jgi:hypothetical protein
MLDAEDYKFYQDNPDELFFCVNCFSTIFPFSRLNNNEFEISVEKGIINTDDKSISLKLSEFQQQIFDDLNTAMNSNAFDLEGDDEDNEDNIIPTIKCNYYTTDLFASAGFNPSKTFSILHYNIHSIQRHIEEFRVYLELINYKFDIICISESKLQKDFEPNVNINIKGYQSPIGTPTESTKGGVLIYVRLGINFKPRKDLNLYKSKELESFFIEIINKKESNDIIGVIYRHPCMDETAFTDKYLKILVDKLSIESKKVFIAGDFNYDLLKVSTHNATFEFFDTMMSNLLLPTITLPTKINRGNNSLIDNIFTNHLHPDTKSGNITINLSDGHLPSFLIIPKQKQNHLPKKHNIISHNPKNFDKDDFILDYFSIDCDEVIDATRKDANFAMENFITKFNELLDKHLPLRKMTQKQFKQTFKPWISKEILKKKLVKKIKCLKNT